VTITRPFCLGACEITQDEYQRVMGANPSKFSPQGQGRQGVAGLDTARYPVESVSWQEAVEFCRRLSDLAAERSAGRVYRLPTEAEWEYACRAGTQTSWSCGDDEAALVEYAWFRSPRPPVLTGVFDTGPCACHNGAR
jgi:formylglycine-generating enzyme required for sulfatase activity